MKTARHGRCRLFFTPWPSPFFAFFSSSILFHRRTVRLLGRAPGAALAAAGFPGPCRQAAAATMGPQRLACVVAGALPPAGDAGTGGCAEAAPGLRPRGERHPAVDPG